MSNVLIVEDETFLLRTFENKLLEHGFKVATARDGLEALSKVNERRPDLILLDIILPRLNGFEFLEKVRGQKGNQDIKIIVLSNLGTADDIERARRLGANDYLVKTQYQTVDIIKKVREYLADTRQS